MTAAARLELDDIQGLVARGYSALESACFLLLTVDDPVVARSALGRLALLATSGSAEPPESALNLAFTSEGMRRLGLDPSELDGFSHEFVSGMTDPNRSRLLGDVGENAPSHWRWGGPDSPPVDVLALLYARDEGRLDRLESQVRHDVLAGGGLTEAVRLGTSRLTDREPFGFRDGISQPLVEGLSKATADDDAVKAGEFVLGYANEYGLLTDRPLLPAACDTFGLLPRAPDGGGAADFGRNGSYLVFRQLRQDVAGFHRYLEEATRHPDGADDPEAREVLAARMVGRWRSGAPLVHAPLRDAPSLGSDNDFGYFATDPEGLSCPLGAHVRRANPRDSLDPRPGSAQSVAIGRRHRILRRGRAYGDGDGDRGLHFLCLGANISRQFEFIQHTWLNNAHFNGLYDGPDPLVAARQNHDATFTVQARPVRTRYRDLPQFVSVQGGAYFFLPGLQALRYLCEGARPGGHR
ncbi:MULTISPECIES: Dyp-type peroxidase [unclassified Streptomyces]|uniref:Dyp-type peroxidase n=1 Tax=unclassified Streptomyces TaxID=2593676 RepID=UPI002E37808A|nr:MULTISPECIES: Dyp-type peroxidase [unclassified Streptomyces]WUC68279.1 Dyp-type peroxidase [Streptomyces sp. NBC_00539]